MVFRLLNDEHNLNNYNTKFMHAEHYVNLIY